MKTFHFIAFDLGATSGRTMLATLTDDAKLTLKELNRFKNRIVQIGDKYHWDIFSLYESLKEGLRAAAQENVPIHSIGIDTWGVDFACLGEDGSILGLPRSYRDPYTNGAPEAFFKTMPREEVYRKTGIQIMNFNSLFQLYAGKKSNSSALKAASQLLFMPDALAYLLTGKKVCEYTIASTSQLLNPKTRTMDESLLAMAGVAPDMFPPIIMPGSVIGTLRDYLAEEVGLSADIPVIATASHDTAAAVAAVPAENERFAYLSSGTWSLMGVELQEPVVNDESYALNFTNEGGVDGSIRFLKNITGMWLLEQCRKEWERAGAVYTYNEITAMAEAAQPFRSLINPDDEAFANPTNMPNAIAEYCRRTGQEVPTGHGEFIRCILDSLALRYREVFDNLVKVAPFSIDKLHVIGGGSQNKLLNQFTANALGVPVVAGPSEATAIGNAMIQAKGLGLVGSLQALRKVIANSCQPEVFVPDTSVDRDGAYALYRQVTARKQG